MTYHLRRVWRGLAGAPYLPMVAYLGMVGIGSLASHDRGILPASLKDVVPWWFATVWTLAVAVGGTLAVYGVLDHRTRIESAGLAFVAVGAVIYGACLLSVTFPHGMTTLALVTAVCSTCAIRMRVLTLARRAQREAA